MRTITAAVAALITLTLAGCASTQQGRSLGFASNTATPEAHYTGPTELPTTDPPSPTPAETTTTGMSIRDTLEITDSNSDQGYTGTVHINTVRRTTASANEYTGPPANGVFLTINVTIVVTAGNFPISPLYFAYQAPDDTTYHYSDGHAIGAGPDPELDSADLSAGHKVRGNVTFDVPRTAHGLVEYESILGDVLGSWTI